MIKNWKPGLPSSSSGTFLPTADDTDDLGSSSVQWKDLYIDGVAYIDELKADTINEETSGAGVTIDGLKIENDGTTTDLLGIVGDYLRIGDAGTFVRWGTPSNLEDCLLVTEDFEVLGLSYFNDNITSFGNILMSGGGVVQYNNDMGPQFGAASIDAGILYETADADAKVMLFYIDESKDSGNNVPAWVFGEHTNLQNANLGLFDEVVQPHLITIENSGKYAGVSNATSVAAAIRLTTATAGTFTNAVIGDIVRVTAGTNATAGWYFVDAVVDEFSVDLDRNWCTGAVTSGVMVACHKLAMMTPKAIYLPIYDAAPADSDIDLDMDGAMALEVTQANGRLYWRANNGWHYVDATAGLSMPKEERVDPDGNKFELGDKVALVIDRINEDGSFHAMPYRRN
ncbi:hypothetical protein LCGC14_0430850 [marine sediment metagenome]|uniref:Uncharacterized protein n=1 Tax=marine sediment metagenome TaxID=412755 RepID=A0A0F9SMZ1_9ZZZZ